MNETALIEPLMVRVMNHLTDRFGAHAVLKGGMVLRLLNCPRYTNDLDYVFVPYQSKKDVVDDIVAALKDLSGCTISAAMHSTCLRCTVTEGNARIQVEVGVARECESRPASTSDLALRHGMQGRIIRIMDLPTALSHKLAAWNERRLMRDLYDVYYLHTMLNAVPDVPTLKKRLESVSSQRGTKKQQRTMSIADLVGELKSAAEAITQSSVEDSLRDYLAPSDMAGLDLRIRAAVNGVCLVLG
jgi:predicted nucleotidyltransferase component of viral defense system